MQLKRVLNAFAKDGVTVEVVHPGLSYVARKGTNVLHFYENGKDSGEVLTFTYRSPNTDMMTDYFEDVFYDTLKGAIKALNEA